MLYSPELLDHFANPRNPGQLPPPAVVVEVTNPVCGDLLRLSARFEGDKLAEARFLAKGCTACLAMGSALTELIRGRERSQLQALREEDLETSLGGLPTESKHVAVLGRDAVQALLAALARASPAGSQTARGGT